MTETAKKRREYFEWIDALVFCAVAIILLFLFFFRMVTVQGVSMEPTFLEGDRLIIRSIAYTPQRGDVVVLDSYTGLGKPLVKRVIAIGGDTINIIQDTGEVYINDVLIEEEYIADAKTVAYDIEFPLTIEEGNVFVMGDNRSNSQDSRSSSVGQIDERGIMGKAVVRVFPFARVGLL